MTSSRVFLERNQVIVTKYLQQNFSIHDRDDVLHSFYQEPDLAVRILEDWKKPNNQKIQDVLNELFYSSIVAVSCFGEPGSGKTSLISFLTYNLYMMSNENYQFYSYLASLGIPFFKGTLFDLNEVPPNCWIYIDELAQAFPARSSNDSNNQVLGQSLITMRHFGNKFLGSTQKASMVDVDYFRFCNFKFFKYVNPDTFPYEREGIITPLIEKMLPNNPYDQSLVLFVSPTQVSLFRYQLPEFWSDRISKNQADFSETEKMNYAKYLISLGTTAKDIQKIMKVRFQISKPLEFYKKLDEN
jgi:hypothetical protein